MSVTASVIVCLESSIPLRVVEIVRNVARILKFQQSGSTRRRAEVKWGMRKDQFSMVRQDSCVLLKGLFDPCVSWVRVGTRTCFYVYFLSNSIIMRLIIPIPITPVSHSGGSETVCNMFCKGGK